MNGDFTSMSLHRANAELRFFVVFAYHDVGVNCLNALLEAGVTIDLVLTHQDDPKENVWYWKIYLMNN